MIENWEFDNIFCDETECDFFTQNILERVAKDFKEKCIKKGKLYNEETLNDALMNFIYEKMDCYVDDIIYEEFGDEDDDDEEED